MRAVTASDKAGIPADLLTRGDGLVNKRSSPRAIEALVYTVLVPAATQTPRTRTTRVTAPETAPETAPSSMAAGCTAIATGAFRGCTGLTKVTISPGITEIKPAAFAGCTSLGAITLPATLAVVRRGAFAGCRKLRSVRLPAGARVEAGAFPPITIQLRDPDAREGPSAADSALISRAKQSLAPEHPAGEWTAQPEDGTHTIDLHRRPESSPGTVTLRVRHSPATGPCPRRPAPAPAPAPDTASAADADVDATAAAAAAPGLEDRVVAFRDNTERVQYTDGLYRGDGADLPRSPTVLVGCCDRWPAYATAHSWGVAALADRAASGCTFSLDGGPGYGNVDIVRAHGSAPPLPPPPLIRAV